MSLGGVAVLYVLILVFNSSVFIKLCLAVSFLAVPLVFSPPSWEQGGERVAVPSLDAGRGQPKPFELLLSSTCHCLCSLSGNL